MQATYQPKRQMRKRQWGAERRIQPLPMMHEKPSTLKIALSRLAIVLTIGLWVVYIISTIIRQFFYGPKTFSFSLQAVLYSIIVTLLTFSALMYLVARQGALQRFSKHVRVPRAELDRYFAEHQPSITVLVPSYNEEPDVIRKTLLSAALQEYPGMRIVLLVDDPPYPSKPAVATKLNATREIGNEIMRLFTEPRERFSAAIAEFERRYASGAFVEPQTIVDLANQYEWAANWLDAMAAAEDRSDHVDIFFIEQVLIGLADELRLIGQALQESHKAGAALPVERVRQLYNRLCWIFSAEVVIFERKKYASLSHEANKAMNLNSYIGLMGRTYLQRETPDGLILIPAAENQPGDVTFPDSDFLLTLDADSILLREYCLRLVYFLQQPDNSRVAVTQTPYSSFRGAETRIERLAGATTDIQHILHQGMSYYGATFWVGANAVIRKKALEDIAETEWIGGFEVRRFIQDRTVIEDTESSIDLTLRGWSLVNYPERLSYSATPPDFGSLIVQRRRWANGGLLILPKLWSQTRERKNRGELVSQTEILLRLNYMASITWASFSLLFILAYPFDGRLLSPFVALAAAPYFLSMADDLKYCGYKRADIFRIYGFNLILLPVNLAGVMKSLQQALTSKKIPFARTPKVKNRTIAPLPFILGPIIIVAFSVFTLCRDSLGQHWVNAAFECFNAVTATWAIASYIGIGAAVSDMLRGVIDWFYVETPPKTSSAAATKPALDWNAVLYHGNTYEKTPLSALYVSAAARPPVKDEQKYLPDVVVQPIHEIYRQSAADELSLSLAGENTLYE